MEIFRCRFVPYEPSAINAVAFSNPKPKSLKHFASCRLALGRTNGDIEIWNPANGAWSQEMIIGGAKNRSIDGLVWVQSGLEENSKYRLFSIGYTSTITEWDLEKAKPRRHASGQHGDIWCLAAQPAGLDDKLAKDASPLPTTMLLAGTMDGELAQYSVEDDGLYFQRMLVRSTKKKTRMVSIAFQSRKVVIIGCSDSTIRAYDARKGQVIRNMTLGADSGSKDIIVWAVKCLPNGNIVSGDSTGHICIWNGNTYTQTQRIEGHKQDVLSLAMSFDGTCIMSGGMDRRTNFYKQNADRRWNKITGRRYHDHDVKSMASFEFGHTSVVVSGGPDANLGVLPFRELGREYHKTINNLPQKPPLATACNARFLVAWWERQVHIWLLRKPWKEVSEAIEEGFDHNKNRKLLKVIIIKGDSNITSATIDKEGTLLIVSTATDVKAYHLKHQNPISDIQVRAIQLPRKLSRLGASQVKLSPDGRWLCLVQEGSRILMAGLGRGRDSETLVHTTQRMSRIRREIPSHLRDSGLKGYTRTITQVAFSEDSNMLAVADLAGYIDTWIQRDHEATLRPVNAMDRAEVASSSDSDSSSDNNEAINASKEWIRTPNVKSIPKLSSSPCVLSFSTVNAESLDKVRERRLDDNAATVASDYELVAITLTWDLIAVHPRQGALTAWSRRNRRQTLPEQVTTLSLPKDMIWHGPRVWVYGTNYLLMLDLSQDLCVATPASKRRRLDTGSGAGSKMTKENLDPHEIRKYRGNGGFEDIKLEGASRGLDSDSDDEVNAKGELSRLRNSGVAKAEGDDQYSNGAPGERNKWFLTHKYRPILGVVPLNTSIEGRLEVALVERPEWDVDVPERLVTDDDRWR